MTRAVGAVLLLGMIATGFAQEASWRLDKSHSSITFAISHMVVSEVVGRFKDFTINFTSSKDDFTDAKVEATIRVGSISTDNENRDKDLMGEKFFNAEKSPEIKFTSTSFEKAGEKKYRITGNLAIRDSIRAVMFDAEYRGSVKTKRGTVVAWKATTTINRFDFGIRWNQTLDAGGLVAGETVSITLNLEFIK